MSARELRPHPARDAILDAMRQYGRPLSPSQLARITGASVGATSYHVRTLAAHKVIELVGEGRVRGAVEHFYTLVADADQPALDPVRQLLGLCGGLTVSDPDGGFPTPSEIDAEAQAELAEIVDKLRPWVQEIVVASTARVRRERG